MTSHDDPRPGRPREGEELSRARHRARLLPRISAVLAVVGLGLIGLTVFDVGPQAAPPGTTGGSSSTDTTALPTTETTGSSSTDTTEPTTTTEPPPTTDPTDTTALPTTETTGSRTTADPAPPPDGTEESALREFAPYWIPGVFLVMGAVVTAVGGYKANVKVAEINATALSQSRAQGDGA